MTTAHYVWLPVTLYDRVHSPSAATVMTGMMCVSPFCDGSGRHQVEIKGDHIMIPADYEPDWDAR